MAPTLEIKATIPGRDTQGILRARFDGTPMATQTEVMTQATTPAEQEIRDFIVKRWRTLDMFKDTEWPIWKRLNLETFEKFVDCWTYEVDAEAKKTHKADQWPVRGSRFNYLIRTPLIENDTLLCNYYPVGEKGTQTLSIDLNDARVFGRASFIHPTYSQRV